MILNEDVGISLEGLDIIKDNEAKVLLTTDDASINTAFKPDFGSPADSQVSSTSDSNINDVTPSPATGASQGAGTAISSVGSNN